MTLLLLVRHAAHGALERVLSGRTAGVRLSEAGQRQAGALAERLRREALSAILSSPVERALATAAAIADRHRLHPREHPGLDEVDFGEWTGRSFEELGRDLRWRAWNESRATGRAPGGESMSEVQDRALAAARDVVREHPAGSIVLVSHAEVIRALLLHWVDLPLGAWAEIEVAPASVSRVELQGEAARVLGINEMVAA